MPLVLNGNTSGSTTINATDAVTATITLPSTTGTLLSTANPQSGGVIQVVSVTYNTQTSIASETYVDTGLSASITPKFSTSKILVSVSHTATTQVGTNNVRVFFLELLRASTLIARKEMSAYGGTGANGYIEFPLDGSFLLLDTPATTSSVTYKTRGRVDNAGSWASIRINQSSNGTSTIVLLEIAA